MSERKARVFNSPAEKAKCSACGATIPWHFRDCVMVVGKLCPECQALLPRHYSHCSLDYLNFNRWWMPRAVQKELWELYRSMKTEYEYKHGRLPSILTSETQPEKTNEQYVRPDKARKILMDIMTKLRAKGYPPRKIA